MQFESFAQPGQSAFASAVVRFALTYDFFQPRRQQGADRSVLFGRQNPNLAQKVGVQFQSDVSFHVGT